MEVVGSTRAQHGNVHIRSDFRRGAWYHLDQTIESWVAVRLPVAPLLSIQDERDRHRERRYDIYPDSGFYREEGRTRRSDVPSRWTTPPSCIGSARCRSSGQEYEYARYFRPTAIRDHRSAGRERVSVAERSGGNRGSPQDSAGARIFAEKSETRIWLSTTRNGRARDSVEFSFGQ